MDSESRNYIQGILQTQTGLGILRLAVLSADEGGMLDDESLELMFGQVEGGALPEVLPEVTALFGVPQIADDPPQVDIGHHLLRVLDQAARCNAPLPVRFAALVMNVGKTDSLPEHLPVHYRHVDRGRPRIEAICERFGIADGCRELALPAGAGRMRAGAPGFRSARRPHGRAAGHRAQGLRRPGPGRSRSGDCRRVRIGALVRTAVRRME